MTTIAKIREYLKKLIEAEPEALARLSFWLAIFLTITAALTVLIVYWGNLVVPTLSGNILISSKGITYTGLGVSRLSIIYEPTYPSAHPSIVLRDAFIPIVTYLVASFSDKNTFINVNGKVSNLVLPYNATFNRYGAPPQVKVLYYLGGEPILAKYVILNRNCVDIFLRALRSEVKIDTVGVKWPWILRYALSTDNRTLEVVAQDPLLGLTYTSRISFEECRPLSVVMISHNTLRIYLNMTNRCHIIFHKPSFFEFSLNTLDLKKLVYGKIEPSVVKVNTTSIFTYVRLTFVDLLPYLTYILILPLIAIIVYKKYIVSNFRSIKSLILFHIIFALLSSYSAQHWDALQTVIFAFQATNLASLYRFTAEVLKATEPMLFHIRSMYAGYTYPLPWIAILVYPISVILQSIGIKYLFISTPYHIINLLFYPYPVMLFEIPETIMIYTTLSLYYLIFNIASMLIAYKLSEELNITKDVVYSIFYSPIVLAISYYWKMFEILLLPFFLASLLFILKLISINHRKEKSKLMFAIAMLLSLTISITLTKVYTLFLIMPFLIFAFIKRDAYGLRVSIAFSILVTLAIIMLTILSVGLEKYIYATFLYQAHRPPEVMNYYPALLSKPVLTTRYIKLLSTIVGTILLFLIITTFFRKTENVLSFKTTIPLFIWLLRWSLVFSSIYYLFLAQILSPQNFIPYVVLWALTLGIPSSKEMITLLKKWYAVFNIAFIIYLICVFPTFIYFGFILAEIIGSLPIYGATLIEYYIIVAVNVIGMMYYVLFYLITVSSLVTVFYVNFKLALRQGVHVGYQNL
jgi:hypothetical protein